MEVIEGPLKRTGATGPILSLYISGDPESNLIEGAVEEAVSPREEG